MMPVKGLQAADITLPRLKLHTRKGIYFSAIVLSMWDNIHGPKIIAVWEGDDSRGAVSEATEAAASSPPQISVETLLTVANYSLNDEAGRAEKLDGIESKFFALLKYNIIASAFIFTTEVNKGRMDVFSIILILPYSEMSEFLARHSLCEGKIQKLLEEHFIAPVHRLKDEKGMVRDKVMRIIPEFSAPLQWFTQIMFSIRHCTLPERINIAETFLGRDLDQTPELKQFLQQAITSHLQSSGYTVVLGEDRATVNKMVLTLGLFLSPKERKMSRLAWQLEEKGGGGGGGEEDGGGLGKTNSFMYEPDLFLQGYVVNTDPHSFLPFTKISLSQNKLPPTLISVTNREVRVVETNVPIFIRKKEDNPEKIPKKMYDPLSMKDLGSFKELDKDLSSLTVQEFLEHLKLLPAMGGVREAYIRQFTRLLKLKALALAKYVDAEPKSTIQQAGEQLVTALALRGSTPERSKVNLASLQHDLCVENNGDFHILLAFAEKMRPDTYFDVLGDPHLQAEAVLKEMETF